jgi:hypothetical protein
MCADFLSAWQAFSTDAAPGGSKKLSPNDPFFVPEDFLEAIEYAVLQTGHVELHSK